MSDEELILMCAVRYALGRQSYIVGTVVEYVARKRKILSDNCIKIIVDDIDEQMRFYHSMGQTLGMECDERRWFNLLFILREEGDLRDKSRKTQNCEKTE